MSGHLGHTLRAIRTSRNETLADVARSTGLSVAMLSRIERGERFPSPEALHALARHFDLPARELVGEAVADHICARYGSESASWAAVLLVRTASPDAAARHSPRPTREAIEFAARDLRRMMTWGDRRQAIEACSALRDLAAIPLRALRDAERSHPDPVVRSLAAEMLRQLERH